MKFFNFFKNNKNNGLPDRYKDLVTPEEYRFILDIVHKYHSENGMNISSIENGDIIVDVNGEQHHRYLDNLIRSLPPYEKELWRQAIYEHFDKLKDNTHAYNYLFKDFEYAAQFLRALIKGVDIYENQLEQFVCRCDFPETNTFLVIEFEQQFKYLIKEDIAEWGKATNELFDIAIGNTPAEEIEIKEYSFCDKFLVYIFFSGDFSSSLMLDLAARAEFAIGTYGSLIAIPAKGTSFVHPIETGDIMELVETLTPTIEKFFNEDPGSITTNFYWLYGDKIEKFPVGQDNNGHYVRLPQALLELFKRIDE